VTSIKRLCSLLNEPWTTRSCHFCPQLPSLASGSLSYTVQAVHHDVPHSYSTEYSLPRLPVQGTTVNQRRSGQCSEDSPECRLPRCHSALNEHAFSFARPLAWNILPPALRDITNQKQFRKCLKFVYLIICLPLYSLVMHAWIFCVRLV